MAERNDLGILRLLSTAEIEAIPWEPLHDLPGVTHKILWRSGDITLGLIHLDPGASEPGPPHYAAHHHFFVVQGTCSIAGRPLAAGSYAYIPPETEHPTTDVGPEGATVFFTYRPLGPKQAPPPPLHPDELSAI
ncbi:MAG: hypothetical protein MUC45_12660 [Actinomycetia bacterium]|jgi:hypothetical protein|nr:hypothetical protein [Actinomycetes bacterium]